MSDEWDFYFARINDAPASIFMDLGIKADVPLEKRPWLLWVWVQLQAPKPDGLATNEEAARALLLRHRARRVAVGSGQCDERLRRLQVRVRQHVPARLGSIPDVVPVGQQSRTHAQPAGAAGTCPRGDAHELPRKVEHWLHFADESTRAACRDALTAIEFAVEDESVSDEESGDLRYQLVVSRIDSVDSHTINGITIELAHLAREHDGAYEGWDCAVTRGEAAQ